MKADSVKVNRFVVSYEQSTMRYHFLCTVIFFLDCGHLILARKFSYHLQMKL